MVINTNFRIDINFRNEVLEYLMDAGENSYGSYLKVESYDALSYLPADPNFGGRSDTRVRFTVLDKICFTIKSLEEEIQHICADPLNDISSIPDNMIASVVAQTILENMVGQVLDHIRKAVLEGEAE